MVDRYSFHLENAAGEELGRGARAVLPRVLRRGTVDPAADSRPARLRRHRSRSRRSSPSGAVRTSRCARRSAARSGGCRSSRSRTRSSRSSPRRSSRRRSARAGVEALEELREVLNLESLPIRIECFDISNIQGQEIVGSMVVFEDGVAKKGALPQVRRARSRRSGRLRGDARGDRAPLLAPRRPTPARRSGTSRSPPRRTSS